MASLWKTYDLDDKKRLGCMRYGQLMRDGNVRLSNVKHRDIDNLENYTECKLSELIFQIWLTENKVPIVHGPFRNDYSELDPHDDFIVQIGQKCVQVEVKHKTRNVGPKMHYEHCSDKVKDNCIYVFTERTRAPGSKTHPDTSVAHYQGRLLLLGWIGPAEYRQVAKFERAGTIKSNDGGGTNFTLHRDEWNIKIAQLHNMDELLSDRVNAVLPSIPCP